MIMKLNVLTVSKLLTNVTSAIMDLMILMVATSYNGKLTGNLFCIGYTNSTDSFAHND